MMTTATEMRLEFLDDDLESVTVRETARATVRDAFAARREAGAGPEITNEALALLVKASKNASADVKIRYARLVKHGPGWDDLGWWTSVDARACELCLVGRDQDARADQHDEWLIDDDATLVGEQRELVEASAREEREEAAQARQRFIAATRRFSSAFNATLRSTQIYATMFLLRR